MKTEPSTYSFSDLVRDKKTNWNGIRNFQARNFLRTCKKSDLVLIYHSGDDKAVMGLAEVVREAYEEHDPEDPKGDWVQVDLQVKKAFPNPVSLKEIKATPQLKSMLLIRQSRLSVMPLTAAEFKCLMALGGVN